jgi:hypothetical protein
MPQWLHIARLLAPSQTLQSEVTLENPFAH